MLTNASMASTSYAVSSSLGWCDFVPDDISISYLPASHVFERELQVSYVATLSTVTMVTKVTSVTMETNVTSVTMLAMIVLLPW